MNIQTVWFLCIVLLCSCENVSEDLPKTVTVRDTIRVVVEVPKEVVVHDTVEVVRIVPKRIVVRDTVIREVPAEIPVWYKNAGDFLLKYADADVVYGNKPLVY